MLIKRRANRVKNPDAGDRTRNPKIKKKWIFDFQ